MLAYCLRPADLCCPSQTRLMLPDGAAHAALTLPLRWDQEVQGVLALLLVAQPALNLEANSNCLRPVDIETCLSGKCLGVLEGAVHVSLAQPLW